MYRYDAVLVDGILPSVGSNIRVSCHTLSHVMKSTTALLKILFESWFELLCRLSKDEVHAIVLLLMNINISFHLKLVLDGHLSSIESRSILVELRRCVHY